MEMSIPRNRINALPLHRIKGRMQLLHMPSSSDHAIPTARPERDIQHLCPRHTWHCHEKVDLGLIVYVKVVSPS